MAIDNVRRPVVAAEGVEPAAGCARRGVPALRVLALPAATVAVVLLPASRERR